MMVNLNDNEQIVKGLLTQAIHNTHPGELFGHSGTVESIEPAESFDLTMVASEFSTLITEYDSNQYQRDRATAYPSLQDQADMQFHDLANGTTTWLDAIQAVKDAYPKPI